MTMAEEVHELAQMTPRMKVLLVAPGHQPGWSLQAIRVPYAHRNLFARFMHYTEVREALPIPQMYHQGWLMLNFRNPNIGVVEDAAARISTGLGVTINEGQFTHLDFLPSPVAVPEWLDNVMGQRERTILHHPAARFLQEDREGNRLPDHQQWIESPAGTLWIDSVEKKILA